MTTIIEYAVRESCERMKHNGNEFTTGNFQFSLSRITNSKPMITPAIAEAILLSTPSVQIMGLCMWRYVP